MNKIYLNTVEVSKILKVNESTVKRWTDSGFLTCVRTPGGHRKFRNSDIQDFIQKYPIADAAELRLPSEKKWSEETEHAITQKDYEKLGLYLRQLLNNHSIEDITQFLIYLYLSKYEAASIYDNIITNTMEIIGDSWKLGEIGIEDEHYYTGIIESAIQRMQAFIKQKPANGFKAICGCPGNEQHNIGIRCLASQLNSEGWKSYYIGSSLPLESVLSAINTHKPNLVCLSISELSEAQITNCELIHVSALNQKAKLMVGGRAFRSSYQVSADFVSDSISTGIKYAEQIINQDK